MCLSLLQQPLGTAKELLRGLLRFFPEAVCGCLGPENDQLLLFPKGLLADFCFAKWWVRARDRLLDYADQRNAPCILMHVLGS